MGRGRVEEYRRRANGKYLPIHNERPPTGSLELEEVRSAQIASWARYSLSSSTRAR